MKVLQCAVCLVFAALSPAAAIELPPTSDQAPLATLFPDALHALVWRNWGLVEPERLAQLVHAQPEQLRDLAESMGLPRTIDVPPQMLRRGYITLVRRNWHLLPYEQLAELLGVSCDELAFRLREDDFLYVKLGSVKPKCDPVRYAMPSPAARRRAAEIKSIVEQHFGQTLADGEKRFAFVEMLSQLPASADAHPASAIPVTSDSGPRFIYSYFSLFGDPLSDPELDPYPEGLLARLQSLGINGVWLHVVLRQLAPGGPPFPEWGAGHEQRLTNLRRLVDRAKRYGIDVYLYMNEPRAMPKAFFANHPEVAGAPEGEFQALCTSNPAVRDWLRQSLTHVFREVPHLGGIFTITASENLTHCASHAGQAACPRCKHRGEAEIIAEVNAAMEEGVHQAAPDAKVILWDWGWNGHREAPEIIAQLPPRAWLMSVSEWSLPIERGGIPSQVAEYSISAVGPGPRAMRHWRLAKKRGMKTIAKVQLNNSWELSSVPYLPAMNLVAQHCARLAEAQIDGLMLSWSLGGYPSPNLELAQRFARRPPPEIDAALEELAVKRFGQQAAPLVLRAWAKFSRALQQFPHDGAVLYYGPQQMGPANLLYANPTGYAATMVGFPYDDVERWRGRYPAELLASQFEKVAQGWAEGLAHLEAAQALVPLPLRHEAAADLRVAQAAQIHFASASNQTRFVLTRDRLRESTDPAEKQRLRQTLMEILDREIDLARRLYRLACADSRLGYEASNHYFYVPLDLVEKVVQCMQLRSQYAQVRD
jgi:hypothetical protein